ncbi:MAG: glycine dehydrogenase (aminomethyl-transferring), partial [Aquabacterium sp.]|nr:glycine dehydrogenase (aminomethyl-transferring) [Aquabacterium sp.]
MPNTALPTLAELENANEFQARHLGPWDEEQAQMLSVVGVASREALMAGVVPASIRRTAPMDLPAPVTEAQALAELKAIAQQNKVMRNFIGQGYYGTHIPGVILRNILE